MNFLSRFSKSSRLTNFTKIRPVRANLFHGDEWMVVMKLKVPFRNFADMHKNIVERNFNKQIRTDINRKVTMWIFILKFISGSLVFYIIVSPSNMKYTHHWQLVTGNNFSLPSFMILSYMKSCQTRHLWLSSLFQRVKLGYVIGHQMTVTAINCGGCLLDQLPYYWPQQSPAAIQNTVRDSIWWLSSCVLYGLG